MKTKQSKKNEEKKTEQKKEFMNGKKSLDFF